LERRKRERLGHKVLVLNNTHGLTAFRSDSQPTFVAMEGASILVRVNLESFKEALSISIALNHKLEDRERVAFTLFNASFFQTTADSRFLLLVMAVEALVDQLSESPQVIHSIQNFMNQINSSSIGDDDKEVLVERLCYLQRESIGRAARRLVKERLGERIYEGKPALKFFKEIYDMRSRLVHGSSSFPTFREVNAIAAPTQAFVSDLLTAPFVGSS
jgi:hypothetical protein